MTYQTKVEDAYKNTADMIMVKKWQLSFLNFSSTALDMVEKTQS
jgi:hypothetical protein